MSRKEELEARIRQALRDLQATQDAEQEEEEKQQDCRRAALLYLSYGSRSSGMLRRKLVDLEYSEELIADALVYAQEQGYLDDWDLLLRMWRSESQSRGDSVSFFLGRMRQRGIDRSCLEKFKKRYDTEAQNRRCLLVFLKRRQAPLLRALRDGQRRGEDIRPQLNKLLSRCWSHGFPSSLVLKMLREAGLDC